MEGVRKIAQDSEELNQIAAAQSDAMNQAESGVNQISEIADSRVVVSGTTALVAVRYTDAYQGQTTERIREMVAGVVREADPTIQTVAVTSDEEDVTEVYALSDRIRAGENAADMAADIDRIVREPSTLR